MSYNAQFVSALKEALNGLRTVHTVGEEWCSYIGQIPVGGVPYCGQEVTRSTYSALWQYAQNQGLVKSESEWQSWASSHGGNVPYYSSGNGSSTFRMPRLVGYVRGASGQSEAGSYVKEGLPNITGYWDIKNSAVQETLITTNSIMSGALSIVDVRSGGQISRSTTTTTGGALNFDASASNSIYGSSNRVTPETSVVLFGVFAFGEVNNVDALDAGTLASAVARIESNLTRIESSIPAAPIRYVVEKWQSGRQWYTKYNDGWIEQGGVQPTTSLRVTISFNTPFTTTDYTMTGVSFDGEGEVRFGGFTTTSFIWVPAEAATAGFWRAEGY